MFWITTRPCPECKETVRDDNPRYAALKEKIKRDLGCDASNPWPDEGGDGHFRLGLVKICASREKHDHSYESKYMMKCYSCGYEATDKDVKREYEAMIKSPEYSEGLRRTVRAITGETGLWQDALKVSDGGKVQRTKNKVVPELESFAAQ